MVSGGQRHSHEAAVGLLLVLLVPHIIHIDRERPHSVGMHHVTQVTDVGRGAHPGQQRSQEPAGANRATVKEGAVGERARASLRWWLGGKALAGLRRLGETPLTAR